MSEELKPWIVGDDEDSDYCLLGPHDGDGIVYQPVVKLHDEIAARRICACWNACLGIRTEALEHRAHLLKANDDEAIAAIDAALKG